MAGIFISYRREDAQGEARHLFDDLKQHFGADRVFMDVIGIRPGEDYRKVIGGAVASCEVLIALIGREWLRAKTASGQQRLSDSRDFVRLETATALQRDMRVIPVLVQGAEMPSEDALPDELKPLAFRNAIELSHSRWDYDVRVLIEALERVVAPTAVPSPAESVSTRAQPSDAARRPPDESRPRPFGRSTAIGLLFASMFAAAAGGAYWLWRWPPDSPSIVVTDFAGQAEEMAVKAVRDLGLEPVVRRTITESGGVGTVVAQKPARGTSVARGGIVELTIADARRAAATTGASATTSVAATVAVPDLIGRLRRDAELAIRQADLKATWRREPTDDARPDAVIRQQPPASTQVQAGTTVQVTIAVEATVGVPKLTGMTRNDALSSLDQLSLKHRVTERPTSSERPGLVLGQSPPAGTRARTGSVVEVLVAVADLRTVGDLVGKSAREAVEILKTADLRPQLTREVTDEVKPGVVLRQRPTAGTRVSSGAEITLTIAEPASVEVPDVTGFTRGEANDRLTTVGLQASWEPVQNRRQPPGVIVTQTPQPGARVNPGSAITLYVSVRGEAMPPDRAPVEVPDVVGLTRAEASDRLKAVGLEASWEPVPTRQQPPGVIVTQTPQPGARVNPGSAITLYVAVSGEGR